MDLVNKKIEQLNQKHAQTLEELTEDNVSKAFSEEQELYSEVKDSLDSISNRLDITLGKTFKENLLKQLSMQEIPIHQEDLPDFVIYFNRLDSKLEKMNRENGISIDAALEKLFTNSKLSKLGGSSIIAISLIITSIIFIRLSLPIFVSLLSISLIRNAIKHYQIYQIILAYKMCCDNIEGISKLLREKAIAELDSRREAAIRVYEKSMKQLDNSLKHENELLTKAKDYAAKSFEFNELDLAAAHRLSKQNLEIQTQQYNKQKDTVKAKIKQLEKVCFDQEAMLKKITQDIPRQYLNPDKIDGDTIFSTQFILDIEHGKPVFFEHPKKSCLIIYDNVNDVNDFIKLMITQIRKRMNPFAYTITIYDKIYLGSVFQPFVPTDYPQLCAICANNGTITENLTFLEDMLLKRSANIRASFRDIDEYNAAMIQSESVPESYQILFAIEPLDIINNDIFLQVSRIGASLGIYMHCFIQKDDFYDLGDSARTLLKTIGASYTLQDGKLLPKAKSFIETNMIKKSN